MGRSTKKAKAEITYDFDFENVFAVTGIIRKVVNECEKVNTYSVDVPSKTPMDNTAHAFILIKEFSTDGAIEEGAKVHITGHISTGSYEKNGKTLYTTDLIADAIEEI